MSPRNHLALAGLLAAGLLVGCGDSLDPARTHRSTVQFDVAPGQRNGQFNSSGTAILKGFNPVNPHRGDAIVATFFWVGSSNIITSVSDHQTNGTPVGNTYTLVEYVTAGGISMATYVATDVRNFPGAYDERLSPGDSILVVQANLSTPTTGGGMMIASYSGVQPTLSQALGGHSSRSGAGTSTTTADPGAIPVNAGALVYGVSFANAVVGVEPPPGFVNVNNLSDNTMKADGEYLIQGGAGSVDPQWVWFFNSPSSPRTWLASVLSLNEAPTSGPGNLTVTTSTTGSSLDPDGYTVSVDGGASQAIATNGSVTFTNLAAGSHTVVLSGVAGNCTVSGGASRTVTVPSGGTANTSFAVTCSATTGKLTVSTSTTGSSLDPDGYTVTVDGSASQAIATNGSVTFTNLAAGSHTVTLSGVAGNCTVSGGTTRTVTVPSGGTATVPYSVSCTTLSGNLTVTTSTTGSGLDPNGYTVTVDGSASQAIASNGSVTFTNLSAGSHTVTLSGVAANCTVSGGASRTVTVPSGGTASTSFSISCTTPLGNLTVSTSTSGSSLDPDGYTVTLDGSTSRSIATNGSVTFTNLAAGSHTVTLSGVAANCTVSGGTTRTVTVPSGGTASTSFSISCTTPNRPPVVNAGPDDKVLIGLLYTLRATFSDLDNDGPWSYTIEWGDGSTTTGSMSSQGTITVGHSYVTLLPRTYTLRVTVRDSHGATGSDTKVVTVALL